MVFCCKICFIKCYVFIYDTLELFYVFSVYYVF